MTRTLSLARGFYPPSTPFYNTVRIPLNARHGSETSTPAARRFVRLWTPVSDATCVGTVRIPDTNARHSAAHVRLQAAPVSAYVYAVRRVCTRRSRDDARSLPSRAPLAGLVTTNKAVWCPGAVTTPRVADRRPGHLLSYSQEESRTFVGLDDECLESFCKAEGRTSLRSYQPADSALWPLPGYADEETRVHLRPATTTAAAGAAGRRRRPLCDLGTGNFS